MTARTVRRSIRPAATLTALLVMCGWFAAPARAQPANSVFRLSYWPASTTAADNSTETQVGTWTTGFWALDYRGRFSGPLGVHLQLAGGAQSDGGGLWSPSTSGTDTIWSGNLVYEWALAGASLRVLAGYGSLRWTSSSVAGFPSFGAPQTLTSRGFRVGAEVELPISQRLTLTGSVARYPSNSTTFETTGISSSSSSSANDFAASLTYAVTGNWLLEAGYRVTWVNSGRHDLGGTVWNTTVQWQGAVLTVGARF
ncbi:MAG: hypothetical protein A2Z07_04605 [Armatimonadetes bacterium RBG_16_67_12]|nr:MAG: hypothetical protein A2Z07_04605 [Armatimonadetes bacterium RBG_16_67_12]